MIVFSDNSEHEGTNNTLIAYEQRVTSVSAGSEHDDHPADNVLDSFTYNTWRPDDSGDVSLKLSTDGDCDYVAIAAHNAAAECDSIKAGDVSIKTDDLDSGPIVMAIEMTGDDIDLEFKGASSDLRVGVVKAGKLLRMQRPAFQSFSPPDLSIIEERIPSQSNNGSFIGMIMTSESLEVSPSWEHLTTDFVREQIMPFLRASQTEAFFLAWRPQDWPESVIYGWRTGEIDLQNTGPKSLMSMSFDMSGVSHGQR